MGTVWRVHDRQDGRLKAAKILRQSDAATLLRFVREQSMRIDHTHVVTPDSWAAVDDRVLFTMPLMYGGSLADLLAERIMSGTPGLPPRWVRAAARPDPPGAGGRARGRDVHRELKPGNLLLEPTDGGVPHLRLTDFGIAVPLDEPRMTRAAMTIGTPGYMPPEQWVGADPTRARTCTPSAGSPARCSSARAPRARRAPSPTSTPCARATRTATRCST